MFLVEANGAGIVGPDLEIHEGGSAETGQAAGLVKQAGGRAAPPLIDAQGDVVETRLGAFAAMKNRAVSGDQAGLFGNQEIRRGQLDMAAQGLLLKTIGGGKSGTFDGENRFQIIKVGAAELNLRFGFGNRTGRPLHRDPPRKGGLPPGNHQLGSGRRRHAATKRVGFGRRTTERVGGRSRHFG